MARLSLCSIRFFAGYQGRWQCDESAFKAILTLVEHRIRSVVYRAGQISQHCKHALMTAADVELALYLSGHGSHPTPPAIVQTAAAASGGAVASQVSAVESKSDAGLTAVLVTQPLAEKPADRPVPAFFDDRVRRFGNFYRSQFPDKLEASEEYDSAGENVKIRAEKERSARGVRSSKPVRDCTRRYSFLLQRSTALLRLLRSHESLAQLVSLKRMAGCFDDILFANPESSINLFHLIGQDFHNHLQYAVRHVRFCSIFI